MASNLKSSSVKDLQDCLKQREGALVTVAHQRKLDFISLCKAAHSIGLDIDPDKLTEDRSLFCLSSLSRVWKLDCRPFLIFEMLKFIDMSLFIR